MKNLIFAVTFLFFTTNIEAASFDCRKASTLVEQTICSDAKLSELDDSLTQIYKTAIASAPNASVVKSEQRVWLKNVRNKCTNVACLIQAYTERQKELNTLSGKITPSSVNKNLSKQITVRGTINVGQLDSAIEEDNGGNGVMFLTDSKVGDKIFAVCKSGDLCEVTGKIIGEDSQLISVTKVKLIRR